MATTAWAAGIRKAAAWGTSLPLGALHGIKLESESMPEGIPEVIADDNLGDVLSGGTLQGNVAIEGTVVCPMRFEGPTSGLLMALIMGASRDEVGGAGTTIPEEIEAGIVFKHYMDFQPDADGMFATLAIDKDVGVDAQYDYTTCKVSQVELSHSNGKLINTATLIAHSLLRDGTINGDTEFAAITHATDALLMIFTQFEFLITEVTGAEGNLAPGVANEEILVTEGKFTLNRNISGEFESGSNAGFVGEPDINGFPESMVEFTKQDYKSDIVNTMLTDAQTIQAGRQPKIYKCELTWTGVTIPSSSPPEPYFVKILIPACTIVTAPTNAGSPGAKVPVTMTLKVQTPAAASLPNGSDWTWATAGGAPIRLLLQNGNALSILA